MNCFHITSMALCILLPIGQTVMEAWIYSINVFDENSQVKLLGDPVNGPSDDFGVYIDSTQKAVILVLTEKAMMIFTIQIGYSRF
ncbi:MAG: hypothetical protein IPG08_09590 [Sphingobacteriaceae bacterium]|nr:hypothetical protein [Sphingobacteriaceae bacterium]